jgi:acetyltransferase-like isoleucine patch superfamily enzyme
MIRKILQSIAYKIYKTGELVDSRINEKEKKEYNERSATISDTAIVDDMTIYNNQNNKSRIVIGEKSVIQGEILIFKHGGSIVIGKHCFVGKGSRIWSSKNITIGDRVLISHNVNIHDNISHPIDSELRHQDIVHIFSKGLQESIDLREAPIIIEEDAWIGFNAIILKGIRIGKGAIIGAGAIVTKDVPDYAIVVGETAKIKRNAGE